MKQQIQLRRREVDETADLPAELPPLLRRLYASRGVRSAQELERSVKGMLPWQQLSGVEKAVEILYNAFREGTRIIVVGDFEIALNALGSSPPLKSQVCSGTRNLLVRSLFPPVS